MRRALALCFALGSVAGHCSPPTESGPTALVGVLLDPRGYPIEGVTLASLETSGITDASGAFAVRTQPSNAHLTFQVGEAWFTRRYQEADAGRVVEVRLPPVGDVDLRCAVGCVANLDWDVGDGLSARASASCAPGGAVRLRGVPVAPPDRAACRDGAAAAVVSEAGGWALTAAPRRVVAHLGREGCVVALGDRVAAPIGGGDYAAEVAGALTAVASCGGEAAAPVQVAADATELSLVPGVPVRLRLGAEAPERVRVLVQPVEGGGWTLDLAVADGVVAAPPLPAGAVWVLGPEAALPIGATPEPTWRRDGSGAAARWSIRLEAPIAAGELEAAGG